MTRHVCNISTANSLIFSKRVGEIYKLRVIGEGLRLGHLYYCLAVGTGTVSENGPYEACIFVVRDKLHLKSICAGPYYKNVAIENKNKV